MNKLIIAFLGIGLLCALVVSVFIFTNIYSSESKQEDCQYETGMLGQCLPKGKCVAPTDAIVDCKDLQ